MTVAVCTEKHAIKFLQPGPDLISRGNTTIQPTTSSFQTIAAPSPPRSEVTKQASKSIFFKLRAPTNAQHSRPQTKKEGRKAGAGGLYNCPAWREALGPSLVISECTWTGVGRKVKEVLGAVMGFGI